MVSEGIFSIVRSIFRRVLLGEVPGEYRYVLGMIPQRRRHDREHFQAVIEIAAEKFIPHHLGQIAVGCRQQTDVDGDGAGAAQSLEGLFLQSPEQLGLQFQGNVAHLVQKQSPAVRQLKPADLLRQSAGESASLVTEQLALQKPGREWPRSSK